MAGVDYPQNMLKINQKNLPMMYPGQISGRGYEPGRDSWRDRDHYDEQLPRRIANPDFWVAG